MTLQAVDALGADSAPTAILDRVSLVLDAFDGPGRLTLAQVVRSTGLPRLVCPPHARTSRLDALAASRRPRLRTRYAPRRTGIARGSSGPPPRCSHAASPRALPRHRICGSPRHPRRARCGLHGEDRRTPRRRSADACRWSTPRRDHCDRSGTARVRFAEVLGLRTAPPRPNPRVRGGIRIRKRPTGIQLSCRTDRPHRPRRWPRYPSARRRRPSASTTSAQRRSVWRPLPFGEASTADR